MVHQTLQNAYAHFQAGQPRLSMELCSLVLQAVTEQPDALYLLAIIHAQARRYAEADDYFKRAIAASPSRAEYYPRKLS